MLNDTFKSRYTTIPFASFARNHTAGSRQKNIETLSHMHREMELMLVQKGTARMYIDGNVYDISAGDFVIVFPWNLHRATIFADTDFCHICLCFDLSLLHNSILQHDLEKGYASMPPVIHNASRYAPMVQNAFHAHLAQKSGWELQTIGNLSILFGLLLEDGHLIRNLGFPEKDFCRQAHNYIAAHYPESITSANIAAHLHISLSHFCRSFRAAFGQCFQNYLSSYRVEQAKLLLRNSQRSVSEIASIVGFSSFSYFSKVFRTYSGVSPSDYRKTK